MIILLLPYVYIPNELVGASELGLVIPPKTTKKLRLVMLVEKQLVSVILLPEVAKEQLVVLKEAEFNEGEVRVIEDGNINTT